MSIRFFKLFKNSNLISNLCKVKPNVTSCMNAPNDLGYITSPAYRLITTSNTNRDLFNVQDVDDFKAKVLESKEPVLVDFHASWCGPCKILAPRLETIVQSKQNKVHLAKVDIDEHGELAMEYDVTAVPSVLAVKNGKVVDRFIGVVDDDKINSFVDKLIGS